jgi:peptidoglycan hydrolase CwlO-like protein
VETLSTLQDKVEKLIALVKDLKTENAKLEKENKQLAKKIESLSSAAQSTETDIKELSQEKTQTKMVVEDLIKSIDSFISMQ